jgi:hypothetical protein
MNVEGFFEKQDLMTSAKKDFEKISQVLEVRIYLLNVYDSFKSEDEVGK